MVDPNRGMAANWRGLAVLWLLLAVGIYCLPQSSTSLSIDIEATAPLRVQVYLDRGAGLSESDSIARDVPAGRTTLALPLPPGKYRGFRLDPTNGSDPVVLHRVQLAHSDGSVQGLGIDSARPSNIERLERVGIFDFRVTPSAPNNDAQLMFSHAFGVGGQAGAINAAFIAALCVLCLALLAQIVVSRAVSTRALVVALLLVAVVSALALAIGSGQRIDDHPDEFSHVAALRFFVQHGLVPPAVTDPRVVPSVSVWGFSYLFETDVVYPLTALLLDLTGQASEPLLPAVRLCNVALLLLLALAAASSRAIAVAAAVVLLSPQIWYVYGYYNADGLPLTLALILAGLAADEDGDVARFLRGEPCRRTALALFVAVAAVLLCSKRNYLIVFPLAGMWLAVRHAGFRLREVLLSVAALALVGYGTFVSTPMIGSPTGEGGWVRAAGLAGLAAAAVLWLVRLAREPQWRRPFLRLAALGALCVACALPRYALDAWQNGSPSAKSVAIAQVAERLAGTGFKPSEATSPGRYPTMAPMSNGVTLGQVLSEWGWAKQSLTSAYGFYGYMTVPAPTWSIVCLALLTVLFAALGIAGLRRMLPRDWLAPAALSLGGVLLVGWTSLLHSWVNAFNPQGRYLLPAFVLAALPAVAAHRHLWRAGTRSVIVAAALLSAWSFLFVAFAAFMAM